MDKLQHKGLCTTCRHLENCTFRKEREHSIWNCEEFEPATPFNTSRNAVPIQQKKEEVYNSDAPAGLCKTCDNFPTCTFTKPEGGVWFCNEYR